LKHSGIDQLELCEIILHLLRLLSATVTIRDEPDETNSSNPPKRNATIHYENVGYLYKAGDDDSDLMYQNPRDAEELEEELTQGFAMPAPAREVLLFFLINMLGNKGPLRSVSNAAVYLKDSTDQPRHLLIIHWKPLLRMFLRTAPYLDEHKVGKPPSTSNSRQNTTLQRTVQLIRDARHFFDQGFRPPSSTELPHLETDRTARELWNIVKNDVLFHSHTHACYRSSIILYLFQPSRCSSQYYLEVLPDWYESWTNIDRCPEYDFLWLAMFCRARKHVSPDDYDWGRIRKRILTHSQYWLQLPIGGASMDKLFPRAGNPRSRSCPSRLKEFVGSGSSYEEGIDFVAKVTKLLVTSLGAGEVQPESSDSDSVAMSQGTRDMLRFLSFVTPYFNPSNLGSWTFTLGAFLHYFSYELCCRVGNAASMEALKSSNPAIVDALCEVQPALKSASIPSHEMVALMDALLPLCQQAMYSKNGHVGRAGEAAMLYLIQIDPVHTAPAFIDFATRALDISAVNLAHQAPAALSALTRLIQPALRSNPNILLARLPEILRLCLAGIDRNDQNKTIRTLILYRSITSWMPVGGQPANWMSVDVNKVAEKETSELVSSNGTTHLGRDLFNFLSAAHSSSEYMAALEKLPATSLLRQGITSDNDTSPETQRLLLEETAAAMDDWVLEFLDRIFTFLRASGEREKAGKTSSGVASRHSSVDVQQARNFSRVLQECLAQVFAALNESVFELAIRSVTRFFREDTLPWAAKDASFVCQAVSGARRVQNNNEGALSACPGLDALVPILTDDLEHHSIKTVGYRLRCLAGAVKGTSHALIKHRQEISKSIDFALASTDKHLFKVGCKLLRHTLAALCESYPVAIENMPRTGCGNSSPDAPHVLGRSAQLAGDAVKWHVPDAESIEFAWSLLNNHILQRLDSLSNKCSSTDATGGVDIPELRRCLRVIRYSLRGGSCILLDRDDGFVGVDDAVAEDIDTSLTPHEIASQHLLGLVSAEVRESLMQLRGRLAWFMVAISSIIANETYSASAPVNGTAGDAPNTDRKYQALISSDAKVCKETCDIALLLLTRRGANFRSQEARNIWKAQKQSTTDFSLCAMADHIVESLQRAALYCRSSEVFYKDGEDAGKTVPRRLLVTRVKLFHDSLKRNASFEIPRRLRRLNRKRASSGIIIFDASMKASALGAKISEILNAESPMPLAGYEGLMDGLFCLCCHSNTQVRAAGISVVDYAITRFGWLVKHRVPRLLAAVSIQDEDMHGKFGIPSTSKLVAHVDLQGKRKRLAEAMKGVISLLALPRSVKEMMSTDDVRLSYIKTACGTDTLISLLPPEEIQKMVHYLQSVFSKFRSKFYSLPRASSREQALHNTSIRFLLDLLSESESKMKLVGSTENAENAEPGDSGVAQAHWRKLLLVCWFIMAQVDSDDLNQEASVLASRLWATCFHVIENEMGQPLQRVALGLFGRIVALAHTDMNTSLLRERMVTESFCKVLGKALVYDHKEDASFGGGHDAQWSTGVEDIIRDASRNVAPRSLFPFQRTSQSSTTFKVSHAQLVEKILIQIGVTDATTAAKHLLAFATEIAASPPSEDQRNQQCTSAEIFSGVCRALLRLYDNNKTTEMWNAIFLPYLEEVIPKIPVSFIGAYFDSLRFVLQFSPPNAFYPLTAWLFAKVEATLWQPKNTPEKEIELTKEETNGSNAAASTRAEGFTIQSKWLYLSCALLIEIDETEVDGTMSSIPWYTNCLAGDGIVEIDDQPEQRAVENLEKSWELVYDKLLPRLTEAVGHPYESCRDHIAGCLFRICHCHRKKMRVTASRSYDHTDENAAAELLDPGTAIVKTLSSLEKSDNVTFNDRYNALITARRFFSYCIHLGEAKHEYSDYIIPLLPLAFEALKSTVEDGADNTDAAQRTLEAEVVKGYRYTIAELSITSVISYGNFEDITRVLDVVKRTAQHEKWQVRHASAHFLRSFQGSHKFLFGSEHADITLTIVTNLLADGRREVSSAAMAALTGILAASPIDNVARMVKKYVLIAKRSAMKRKKKGATGRLTPPPGSAAADSGLDQAELEKEQKRATNQLTSVFFLCASILAQPYDTPPYVPEALAAISKHSFERNAPLGVRDTVKKCCAEYKRTHMSDNWELHRSKFSQEQLEALEDVVSSPHYYA
jgi:hypothetical protein